MITGINDMKAHIVVLTAVMMVFGFVANLSAQTTTNNAVTPTAVFSVRDYSGVIGSNNVGTATTSAPDPTRFATVIFNVPPSATNAEAFFAFKGTLVSPGMRRLEIFAFDAPAVVTTNIVNVPRMFVDAIE